jgi:hypothetical protein
LPVLAVLSPGYEAWSLGAGGVVARRDVAAAVRAARRRGPCAIGPIELEIRDGEAAPVTALT